jgi:hypothetical protein
VGRVGRVEEREGVLPSADDHDRRGDEDVLLADLRGHDLDHRRIRFVALRVGDGGDADEDREGAGGVEVERMAATSHEDLPV